MIVSNKKSWFHLFSVFLLATSVGCGIFGGEEDEDDDDSDTSAGVIKSNPNVSSGDSSTIPQVDSINLNSLGQSSTSLALEGDSDCQQSENNGVFGLALGAACHTIGMHESILIGEDGDANGDGTIDCSDLGDNSGFLLHLMCERVMRENSEVVTLAFADTGETMGMSFADIDGNGIDASGFWTQGDDASFPANMTMFQGSDLGSLSAMVGVGLTSINEGNLYGSFGDDQSDLEFSFYIDFKNASDASGCADDPSDSTCYRNTVSLYAGEGAVQGPPNGFYLSAWASGKENADFIALEGKFRYSATGAASAFSDGPSGLSDVRTIYFRVIQNSTQLWGHFDFQDENGDTISGSPFSDFASSAGVCATRGSDDYTTGSCSSITTSDYDDMWAGSANITAPSSDQTSGITFPAAPSEIGLCNLDGDCASF